MLRKINKIILWQKSRSLLNLPILFWLRWSQVFKMKRSCTSFFNIVLVVNFFSCCLHKTSSMKIKLGFLLDKFCLLSMSSTNIKSCIEIWNRKILSSINQAILSWQTSDFPKFYKAMIKKHKLFVELLNTWPQKSSEKQGMESKLIGGALVVSFMKWWSDFHHLKVTTEWNCSKTSFTANQTWNLLILNFKICSKGCLLKSQIKD